MLTNENFDSSASPIGKIYALCWTVGSYSVFHPARRKTNFIALKFLSRNAGMEIVPLSLTFVWDELSTSGEF